MRSLAKTENQLLTADTVARFVRRRTPTSYPTSVAQVETNWKSVWPDLAELGLLALAFPEDQDGLGADARMIAAISAELGPALLASPFIESAVVCSAIIASLKGAKDLAGGMMTGETVVTFIDGRSAAAQGIEFQTRDGEFSLQGRALAQPFSAEADTWLVAAVHSNERALFLVSPKDPSIKVNSYRLLDAQHAADVEFSNYKVSSDAMLAKAEAADALIDRALRFGRLAICAEAFGIMGVLLSLTAEYLRTRVQFGKKLGAFQALQHRFSDMHIEYAKCHATLSHYCDQFTAAVREEDQERAALSAYVVAAAAARRIGHEAIQLHGGIGATLELPTSHLNSRLAAIRRFGGGRDAALVRLSRLNGFI